MLLKQSLSEQIYLFLKKDIIMQKIECGTKLTIKELEKQFNVSSTPVREALTRLAQEGLIEFTTNLGARVCEFTLDDLREITEICELFDCYALEKAMSGDKFDELVKTLEKSLEEHKEILKDTQEMGEWYYNNEFHRAFYNFMSNERIRENSVSYRAQFSMVVVKSNYNESLEDSYNEHKMIFEAVKERNVEKATSLLKAHFKKGQARLEKVYEG